MKVMVNSKFAGKVYRGSEISLVLCSRKSVCNNSILCIRHVEVLEQCWPQSIFGDTVYSCYCEVRLVTSKAPQWRGLRGWKFLSLITLDRWKRHFWEKNYIENYFHLLKRTESTKTTSQKCWRNILNWAPIPHKRYQNTSGFAAVEKNWKMIPSLNVRHVQTSKQT